MSNSASTIGLPVLRVSSSASSAARSRTMRASSNSTRPRSCAVASFQAPASNAARAALTARSTSAGVGVRHPRDHLGRRRIDDVDGRGRAGRDEFAVDVELVCRHGGQPASAGARQRGKSLTICSRGNRCKVCRMKTVTIAAVGALFVAGPSRGPAGAEHALTSGQADAHPTFTVGTATAQRGQRAYGVLKVPAGSDAGYDIPVAVLHGAQAGPGAGDCLGRARHRVRVDRRGAAADRRGQAGRSVRHADPRAARQRAVVREADAARQPDGQQEHEQPLSRRSERDADRSRIGGDHQRGRRAVRSPDRSARRRSRREPAAVQLLDGDRQPEAGSGVARDAARLRPRSHHHLRPAEGSEGVALSREHRHHARQGVVHGGGRALGTGRRRATSRPS